MKTVGFAAAAIVIALFVGVVSGTSAHAFPAPANPHDAGHASVSNPHDAGHQGR